MIPTRRMFPWGRRRLRYYDHPYNDTLQNERAVEIPIALAWLAGKARPILEVGNVLSHYVGPPLPEYGMVVDRYEEAPHVRNIDVFDIHSDWPTIVSISTLEHVERDGRPASAAAYLHLTDLLVPGGSMLVTVPFGANPFLDETLATGAIPVTRQTTYQRDPDTGNWLPIDGAWPKPYGLHDPWAAAVWVGEYERPA